MSHIAISVIAKASFTKVFTMSSATEARLHFLSASARLCSGASPSTAAHLMSERLALASTLDKKPKPDPVACCLACGTLLVPGLNSRRYTASQRQRERSDCAQRSSSHTGATTEIGGKKRRKPPREPLKTVLVEECLVCWRRTVHSLPAKTRSMTADSGRIMEHVVGAAESNRMVTAAESTMGQAATRNRRKRTAPKGLLAKSKAEEEQQQGKVKGIGELDLMDFLRAV